jgi:hypothetical protein
MLDPRAVALQGIGFTPPFVALQGFVIAEEVAARRPRRHSVRFEPYRPTEQVSLAQLRADDELVTDLLIALVTKGFFNG